MEKMEFSNFLREVRRFEKNKKVVEGKKIRIAVLGSFSIQYFVKILHFDLAEAGYDAEIYEGEYAGINMDVFQEDSPLYQFDPDYIIILPYYTDIRVLPQVLATEEQVENIVREHLGYYQNIWNVLSERVNGCRILQSNIVLPAAKVYGNLEYQLHYSQGWVLKSINEEFVSQHRANVTIIDIEGLASDIGKYQWFDEKSYFLNKTGVRMEYMPELVMLFVRQILALQGNTKKCLALDLDNTLWGGVVGDDGWQNIQLDPNHAVGEAYRAFQSHVLKLKERGIILAVCSKNEDSIAKEPFEKNENMILHLSDISCFVANWNDKAENIKLIAKTLNIGLDSLVFFDDNPAEREIVRQYVPEVHVVNVPEDPAEYVLQIQKESPFEWLQITKEDINRVGTYNSNADRERLLTSFTDYDEYLKALEMKGDIRQVGEDEISRFAQLINKSNQFNLRTIRYTEADVRQMMRDSDCKCLYANLEDKFSKYGIISCVILRKQKDACFIDTWVMSCRVLKRGVEYMMFDSICEIAKAWGCTSITAEYLRTAKNKMVAEFYETLGFDLVEENGTERKAYRRSELTSEYEYNIQ